MERRATASGEYQPHGSSMSLVEESSVVEAGPEARRHASLSAAELLGE